MTLKWIIWVIFMGVFAILSALGGLLYNQPLTTVSMLFFIITLLFVGIPMYVEDTM